MTSCRKKDSAERLKFIKEFAKGLIHNLKNLSNNTDGTHIKEKSLVKTQIEIHF